MLARAGLPAPVHHLVRDAQEARSAALDIGWPVVVKPANLERGEGVSVDIRDEQQLLAAFDKARALSSRVLVERQVAGVCHRIFVIGDKVNLALKRLPKFITGDGERTVEAIIEAFNQANRQLPPWERKIPLRLDAVASACLSAVGLSPQAIAPKGQRIALRPIESTEWGGEVEDLIDSIHPDNVRAAIEAAAVMGLHVAGVDMISPDISQPWHSNGAIINELNFSPVFSGQRDPVRSRAFIQAMVKDDGRIPVWALTGQGDLMAAGRQLTARLAAQGLQVFLTSATHTENASGEPIAMVATRLFDRCIALSMNKHVEALVMLVEDDEILRHGMPFDRIHRVFVTGTSGSSAMEPLRPKLLRRLLLHATQKVAEVI